MKLMIVESPNKVEKISGILGNNWKVAASVGHVRDLPQNEMGVEPPEFRPHYVFTDRGQDVCKRLKGLASSAEEVYLATDPDREGEAISWHLKEALALRNYQRVTFDAITAPVIQKAIQNPRQINDDLVRAQEARRILDRLVGYQVSPILSHQTGVRGLSAGRVQSPAVRLVVDRERQIKAFRETKHFGAEVSFDADAWRAQWNTKPFLQGDTEYILDEQLASRAAACRDFRIKSSGTKKATTAPPAPFTTSTLLQAASVTLHFSPETTAQLAQKLFEQGLITYHRTDSQNFSEDALIEIRSFAQNKGWDLPSSPRTWKSKQSAQEAHEAIRPTHLEAEEAGETPDQKVLYKLIWTRAVASQLADAEYNVTTVELESASGTEIFLFVANGRTLTSPGWKALTAKDAAEEDDDKGDTDEPTDTGKVPQLAEGSHKQADSGKVLFKKTKPPKRYTQASLIKKLENIGIGRPSTYAAILKNIMGRNYLEEQKKYLVPTDLGCLVVDSLSGKFTFVEFDFTKQLEQELDDIAEGKAHFRAVITQANDKLSHELGELHLTAANVPAAAKTAANGGIAACPKCGKGQIRHIKAGDKSFFGCSDYKSGCKFTIPGTVAHKALSETVVKQLCTGPKYTTTSPVKGLKRGDGKPFSQDPRLKLLLETGKIEFQFEDKKQ
jgi:DNA topoisomerase-1